MPRFFSHPVTRKRSKRSKRSKRNHTKRNKKQRGGRGGGGGLGGASYHGAFTTGATQELNQMSPSPY